MAAQRVRTKIGFALAAALVVVVALPAQASIIGGSGPITGGNTVQVDVAGSGFTTLFGGPASSQAYGLTDTSTLYAWGKNGYGQLGDGTTSNRLVPTPVTATGALAGKTIVQVQGGTRATIALADDGSVFTWGDNSSGQLAQPSSVANSHVPVQVPMTGALTNKHITQIASGGQDAYALASDGSLFAWGDGNLGKLGVPGTADAFSPVEVSVPGQTFTQIAATTSSAVALTSNGTLYAWGQGTSGQLGNGTSPSHSTTPVAVTMSGALNGMSIRSIAGMGSGVLVLGMDGTVAAWGSGVGGALGNGSSTGISTVPITVSGFGASPIVGISGYQDGGLALAADGTQFAWGSNASGTIGTGSTTPDALVPTSAPTSGALAGKTITQVVGAASTALARTDDGSVIAWGDSTYGSVGNGSTGTVVTSPAAATMPAVGITVGGSSVAATRVGATRFSFTAPAHAAGTVDVVVGVGGNARYGLVTTTLSNGYSYNPPPTVNPTLPDPTQGVAYSELVATGNPSGTTYIVTSGTLPAGLSLGTSSGVLSGTPTTAGSSTFEITASNTLGSSAQTFTVTTTAAATPPPPPSPMPTATPTPSATPTPTGTPTVTPTPSATPTPTSSATPTPSDTPTPTWTDTPTPSATTTSTVSVAPTPGPSTTTAPAAPTPSPVRSPVTIPIAGKRTIDAGRAGSSYRASVAVSGAGVRSYSVVSGALPAGLTLNTTTGVISGTPRRTGSFSFRIGALIGSTLRVRTYSIRIDTRLEALHITADHYLPGGIRYVVGNSVQVTMWGLAPHERYTIRLSGVQVGSGTATAGGRVTRSVIIPPQFGYALHRIRLRGVAHDQDTFADTFVMTQPPHPYYLYLRKYW